MPEYVVVDTPNILNCTGVELYYVSWSNGVIVVFVLLKLPRDPVSLVFVLSDNI